MKNTLRFFLLRIVRLGFTDLYIGKFIRMSCYRFDPIQENDEFDDSVFSSVEKAILDSDKECMERFLKHSLIQRRHGLLPREELSVGEPSDQTIQKDQMGDYSSSVKEKYYMINPNDLKSYTLKYV